MRWARERARTFTACLITCGHEASVTVTEERAINVQTLSVRATRLCVVLTLINIYKKKGRLKITEYSQLQLTKMSMSSMHM